MSTIDIPAPLTPSKWDSAVKTPLGKDKAVSAKVNPAKAGEALKTLGTAHGKIDWSVFEPKVTTAAEGDAALAAIDAAIKGPLKDARGAAKLAEAALDEFAASAEKVRKTFQGDSGKLVVAVMGEASKASDAATKLEKELGELATEARTEVVALMQKLKGAAKKDAGGKAKDPKAQKFLKSKTMECIRKIKSPVPNAKPWRFMVVKGTATIGIVTLQTVPGGSHEKMLKSVISGEKTKTMKDPKGEIVWENKAFTLVSDRLSGVPAKKLQEWLKKITGLTVKCRIRKSTGEVDEADAKDLADADLKADPAEAAEKNKAGQEYEKRIKDMMPTIAKAMASPIPTDMKADIKRLVNEAAARGKAKSFEEAADALDELESLLDEDMMAVAAAAPSAGFSVKQLAQARLEWSKHRSQAVTEIKGLITQLVQEFATEPEQKPKVADAVKRFNGIIALLKDDLDKDLDAALGANDPDKRLENAAKAKRTLDEIRDLIENDEVMQNLDGNELTPSMRVVAPMKKSLDAVEAALG
jgi:hypothetical protein